MLANAVRRVFVHYDCCSMTRFSYRCIASFCPEWPLGAQVYESDTPQIAGHSVYDNREPIPSLNMVVEKNKLQNLRLYILSLLNTFTDACHCTITIPECLKCHIHLD